MGRDDNGAVVKSGHVRNLLADGVRKRKVQEGAGVETHTWLCRRLPGISPGDAAMSLFLPKVSSLDLGPP